MITCGGGDEEEEDVELGGVGGGKLLLHLSPPRLTLRPSGSGRTFTAHCHATQVLQVLQEAHEHGGGGAHVDQHTAADAWRQLFAHCRHSRGEHLRGVRCISKDTYVWRRGCSGCIGAQEGVGVGGKYISTTQDSMQRGREGRRVTCDV